ncbi:elongation factor P--(R)-beta-lysine ligase [Paraferrimonas sp. SM1919]|uniref:elongation factor P--(R)-beta-lysine ligase n=1 Tax=Paraferrimonas sp. SM1919 TaxID=2662263 RepID=UPI0013D1C787|nr:elongation factor P--(R)-beta-lysine ligase [Paraferrimonas sp. SM1919]
MNWQPSVDIKTLHARSEIIQKIRQFFLSKGVLEVDTPAFSQHSITDLHLHPFTSQMVAPGYPHGKTLYLQTSPEFHMKRLLAAGSGPIYQICKAFRNEENGRFHNPEFTMLEWYRPGFNDKQLMAEMAELLQLVLGCDRVDSLSYQQAFIEHLQLDPLEATLAQLKQLSSSLGFADIAAIEEDKDTLLQLLFSQCIEPQIAQIRPCFIYDFPASQAALAKIDRLDDRVAKRFEVYFKGVELANGFDELTDAKEQLARFENDNIKRQQAGLTQLPIDQYLIAALADGFPDCAGVALGVDRLLMLALNKHHISEVISFNIERA